MISPYDLGKNILSEQCLKVDIDELVRRTNKELKVKLVRSQLSVLGFDLTLITSQTRFKGERLWFSCPNCSRRVRIIYRHPIAEVIGCRFCLNLKYKDQRYKGMIESKI